MIQPATTIIKEEVLRILYAGTNITVLLPATDEEIDSNINETLLDYLDYNPWMIDEEGIKDYSLWIL